MKSKYSARSITQILSDYDGLKYAVDRTSHYVYFFVLGKIKGAPYGQFHLSFFIDENGTEIPSIVQQFWYGEGENTPNGEFMYPVSWLNISYEKMDKEISKKPELKMLAQILGEDKTWA